MPRNPNNYQYLYHTNKIIDLVADKKINILVQSGPLRGQTTLAYALSNAKMIIREDIYDVVDNQG